MKTTNLLFVALFATLFLTSCSPRLTPFTDDLQDKYEWSNEELKKIQFYVSRDIVLRREISDGTTEIESGRIRMVDGRKVEEVVIRKGTPGVYVFSPKEDRFAVSFESGDDRRFLMFGPNPKVRGRYVLLASEWKRRRGIVTYEDKKFYTSSESAYAALMVDLRKVRKVAVKSRVAKGRDIDG